MTHAPHCSTASASHRKRSDTNSSCVTGTSWTAFDLVLRFSAGDDGVIEGPRWWVRERHRQRRSLEIVPTLPFGSVYVDDEAYVCGPRSVQRAGLPGLMLVAERNLMSLRSDHREFPELLLFARRIGGAGRGRSTCRRMRARRCSRGGRRSRAREPMSGWRFGTRTSKRCSDDVRCW